VSHPKHVKHIQNLQRVASQVDGADCVRALAATAAILKEADNEPLVVALGKSLQPVFAYFKQDALAAQLLLAPAGDQLRADEGSPGLDKEAHRRAHACVNDLAAGKESSL
jgi:hypothetical protein